MNHYIFKSRRNVTKSKAEHKKVSVNSRLGCLVSLYDISSLAYVHAELLSNHISDASKAGLIGV